MSVEKHSGHGYDFDRRQRTRDFILFYCHVSVLTNDALRESFHLIGKSQGPQGILGDRWKFPFRSLGLFRNWCEYPVLVHRIHLPCIPNGFVYWTQKQGGWCSVVRLLGLVFFLLVDRDIPGIHPLLDPILFRVQVGILALGHVAPNPWRKIPLRQLSERLFEEELCWSHVPHRYSNGRGQKVGRHDR